MARGSLFTILSRQPWWVSLLIAMGIFAVTELLLPPMAPFVALPFVVIAIYIAWKQMRTVSPANVEERLAALRAMPWENFGLVIHEAYRRRGYSVEDARSGAFDFKLAKDGRVTLVQCRRWKVNQVGVGPVRELHEAMDKHDAFEGVCISAAEFSKGAREFAAGKRITLLNGAALAELVGTIEKTSRRWFGR